MMTRRMPSLGALTRIRRRQSSEGTGDGDAGGARPAEAAADEPDPGAGGASAGPAKAPMRPRRPTLPQAPARPARPSREQLMVPPASVAEGEDGEEEVAAAVASGTAEPQGTEQERAEERIKNSKQAVNR